MKEILKDIYSSVHVSIGIGHSTIGMLNHNFINNSLALEYCGQPQKHCL